VLWPALLRSDLAAVGTMLTPAHLGHRSLLAGLATTTPEVRNAGPVQSLQAVTGRPAGSGPLCCRRGRCLANPAACAAQELSRPRALDTPGAGGPPPLLAGLPAGPSCGTGDLLPQIPNVVRRFSCRSQSACRWR